MAYVFVVRYISPVNGSVSKAVCPTDESAVEEIQRLESHGLCVLGYRLEDDSDEYRLDI